MPDFSSFETPLNADAPNQGNQENNVVEKILKNLFLIRERLTNEIKDSESEIKTNKNEIIKLTDDIKDSEDKIKEKKNLSFLSSIFSTPQDTSKIESQVVQKNKEIVILEGKIKEKQNTNQEKNEQIKEIEKLQKQLKDKSPEFVKGFLNEYKSGKDDILKPIEETLNQIKGDTNLEINRADSLQLLSDTKELLENLKTQKDNINKNVKEFSVDKKISTEDLKKFDWEKPIKNNFYHNITPIKDLNHTRIQLYEAIALDAQNIGSKTITMPEGLKKVDDIEGGDNQIVINDIESELDKLKEEIGKATDLEELDKSTASLNEYIKFFKESQKTLDDIENEHRQQIMEVIESATNTIVNNTSPNFTSKETGPILLENLKALNTYDTSQKELSEILIDPSENKDNVAKKDISYYFVNGEGKDQHKVQENKLRLGINENKKDINKNIIQNVSAYENLQEAQKTLDTKIDKSKTLNGTERKNENVKNKAVTVKASLNITMDKIQNNKDILDAINPKSEKPWVIPEKNDTSLKNFVKEVEQMTGKIDSTVKNIFQDLHTDIQNVALVQGNTQMRSYEDNGLSVNRVLTTGTIALNDIDPLITELEKISNNIDAEVKGAENNIEKIEAYFGLVQATANTAESVAQLTVGAMGVPVSGGTKNTNKTDKDGDTVTKEKSSTTLKIPRTKIDGIISGIGHLSTLGSKHYLEKIKCTIDTSIKNAKLSKDQLEKIVEKAGEAQKAITGKEEIFLPQIKAEEFLRDHMSPNYKDEMSGTLVAKQFKNTDESATTASKIERDHTRSDTRKNDAITTLVTSISNIVNGKNPVVKEVKKQGIKR